MGNQTPNTIAENRRARFDYEILETFEAGIELRGFEVKSAKLGRVQLAGSYAIVRGGRRGGRASPSRAGEVWLLNSQIPPYQPKNTPKDYDPGRTRRLLLRGEEIKTLAGKAKERFSIIPVRAYVKKGFIKIEIAVAKPRKKKDKRDLLKKRAAEREMRKAL